MELEVKFEHFIRYSILNIISYFSLFRIVKMLYYIRKEKKKQYWKVKDFVFSMWYSAD